MKTINKRTLTITCADGDEVTQKQHNCFVHNLIADISKQKPLIRWRREQDPKEGIIYCTNGLAEGTLMTLQCLADKSIVFVYRRFGKIIYTATETNGDIQSDMHLAALLYHVAAVAATNIIE